MNCLTYSDIENIIDNHYNSETNLLFVCDRDLAEHICNYVLEEYELFDDDVEFPDGVDEYYVSLFFDDDGIYFYCEVARGYSGELKQHHNENEYIDYFICIGVGEQEVDEKLLGENATWSWIEIVDECEDDYEEENDCEECEDKELCLDISIIEDFADQIINAECDCDSCLKNKLYELFLLGKKIGWHDHKKALIDLLED